MTPKEKARDFSADIEQVKEYLKLRIDIIANDPFVLIFINNY